jgi:transcriptional regulator with XRE-family HTH domain
LDDKLICFLLKGGSPLDQKKIGALLKTLRTEKGLTQEQFAEIVMVSSRTVSRWENGNNMPDLDILIQISDYYEIDLRELLDGERKSEDMDKELEENVLKAADYANCQAERYNRRIQWLLLAEAVLWIIPQLISRSELAGNNIISAICDFTEGVALGILIACGIYITGQHGKRIRAFKERLLKRDGGGES